MENFCLYFKTMKPLENLKKIIVLFILAVLGLHFCGGFSLVATNEGLVSSFRVWASHCSGFSHWSTGSGVRGLR